MKSFAKLDYHNALRNFFHKTKGHISQTISHKIEADMQTIEQYEKRKVSLEKGDLIIRFCLNLIGQIVGTAIYSALIIFALREILDLSVNYTATNLILLTLILLGQKVKFRLADES